MPNIINPYRYAPGSLSPVPDILWWKMSDGSGTTVTAAVGPNGTTDAAWVTGESGSGFALDFNGTTQDANTVSAITYGVSIITLTGWFFFDDVSTVQVMFDSSNHLGDQSSGYAIFIGSAVLSTQLFGTSSSVRTETVTTPSAGSWVNIAIVMDQVANSGAGDIKVYYNGVLQTTSISVNSKNTSAFASNSLWVGAFNGGTPGFFYNGRLDDLRIYGRELTPTEILQVVADPQ